MPSASMYASPYTHKEPPTRIDYPDMFKGLFDMNIKYILDSKILALCTLILAIAVFVVILMVSMPFWFELKFDSLDATFGSKPTKIGLTVSTGLFFYDEDHFTNLVFLDKYSNRDVVPKVMAFAQVCCVFGTCLMSACFAGSAMLMLRRFACATGLVFLAGGTTLAGVLQLICIICCGVMMGLSSCEPDSDCEYKDNLVWRMLPIYSQVYRVEPHTTPYVGGSWAFYIAAIGCLLVLAAAVLLWVEALINMKNLTGIRYQQLREVRDPHAEDVNPTDGKKYMYSPPIRAGHHMYGMQPVVYASGPYAPSAPSVGFVQGPSQPSYRYGSESGSSLPGTREIDL